MKRGLKTSEVSSMLRRFLDLDEPIPGSDAEIISSHSLKATMLSWCARYGLTPSTRSMLGRHSTCLHETFAIYSRDLVCAPVAELQKVIDSVCAGEFNPDSQRSEFFRSKGFDEPLQTGPNQDVECAGRNDEPEPYSPVPSTPYEQSEVGHHCENLCVAIGAASAISPAPEAQRTIAITSATSIVTDVKMGSVESLAGSGDFSGDSDAVQEHANDLHCITKHDMLQDEFLTPDILYNCWKGLDSGLDVSLPWETGIFGQIFANQPLKVFPALPEPKWKRPVCPEDIPLSTETDDRPLKRLRPSSEPTHWRQFVSCTDAASWRESQEAKLDTALKRWFDIILQFPRAHATVKQLYDAATLPEQLRILRDVMSGRAPATLIKKANAMLRYLERLRKAKQSAPGTEETLYAYFCQLREASVPLSRLRATIEAIRFTEHIFGIDGLVKLLVSKRCLGASRVIGETVHRQADPFSVEQLAKLHETLHDVHSPFWDRLVSGTALVACYTRSRWMDMQHTDTISLDPDEHDPVYVELRIKEFKTKKANAWRGGVMAAVGPATGVVCGNWLVQWWDLKKSLQAPLEDGYPLLPAPNSAGLFVSEAKQETITIDDDVEPLAMPCQEIDQTQCELDTAAGEDDDLCSDTSSDSEEEAATESHAARLVQAPKAPAGTQLRQHPKSKMLHLLRDEDRNLLMCGRRIAEVYKPPVALRWDTPCCGRCWKAANVPLKSRLT
eukprot:s231_g21.t1